MTNPPTPPTPPKGPKVTVKEPKPNAKPKPADMSKAAKRAAAGAAATAAVAGTVAAGAAAAGVFDSDEETAAAPSMDALDEVVPPPPVAPTDAAPLPDTGDAGAAGGGGPVAHAGGGGGGGAGHAAPAHAASSGPSQPSPVAQAAQATQTAQAASAAPAAPAAQATATVQTEEATGVAAAAVRTGPATATTADGPATATDGPATTMAAPEVDALADVRAQLGTTLEGWTPPEGMDPADADALRAQLQQLVTDYEPVDGQSPADATEILLGQIQQQMATYADEHDGTDPAIAVPDAGTLLEGALPDLTDVRSQLGTTLEGWTPPEGMDPADADALRAQLQQLVTDYEPVAGQTPADATEILLGQIQQQMATYADEHDGTDPAIGMPDAGTLLEGGALPDLTDVRSQLGTTLEGWTPPEGMDPADADALRAQLQQLVTDYEPVAGQTPADATEILLGQIQQQMATYADEHDGTDPAIPLPDPTTMTDPETTAPAGAAELDPFEQAQQALFGTLAQLAQPDSDPSIEYIVAPQPDAELLAIAEAVRTYTPDPMLTPDENAAALREYAVSQATGADRGSAADEITSIDPSTYLAQYAPIDLTTATTEPFLTTLPVALDDGVPDFVPGVDIEGEPLPERLHLGDLHYGVGDKLDPFEQAQQALFGTISQESQSSVDHSDWGIVDYSWQTSNPDLDAIAESVRTYSPDPALTPEENAAALRGFAQGQASQAGWTDLAETVSTVDPPTYFQQYPPIDLDQNAIYTSWEWMGPPSAESLQIRLDELDATNPFMVPRIADLQDQLERTQFFENGGTLAEWNEAHGLPEWDGTTTYPGTTSSGTDGPIAGDSEWSSIEAAKAELEGLDPRDPESAVRIADLNETIQHAEASLDNQWLVHERPDPALEPPSYPAYDEIDGARFELSLLEMRDDAPADRIAALNEVIAGATAELEAQGIDIAQLDADKAAAQAAFWDEIDIVVDDPGNVVQFTEDVPSDDEFLLPDDLVDVVTGNAEPSALTDVFDDITAPAPAMGQTDDAFDDITAPAMSQTDDAFDDITSPAMSQTDDAFDDITAPADDITAPAADVMDDITAQDAPGISETVVDDDPLGVGDLNDPLGISSEDLIPALPDPSGIDPDLVPALDVDDFSIDGVQEGVPGIEETPMQGVPDLPDLTMPEPDSMHDPSDDLGLPDDLGDTPLQQEL